MVTKTVFKWTLPLGLLVTTQAGQFVDDVGRTFNFKKTDQFATRAATGALSLYRMGIEDQITSVWGLWSIRGSDLDVDNPAAGSRYPESDPSIDEVIWLKTKNNMSPGCYTNPRGCFQWDSIDLVKEFQDEIDYILFIDNGVNSGMKTATDETGIPVVFVDTFFENDPGCRYVDDPDPENADFSYKDKTKCYGRSMIDVANRIEELAIAIGEDDVNVERMEADKALLCETAQIFTDTMKRKQEEGLRVMTSINAIKKDDDTGEDYFEIRTLDPIDLWIPRTLEELGMPIVHHDDGSLTLEEISTRVTGEEFFPLCDGVLSESCNSNPLYPIDFWLFDSRSYLNILDNEEVVKAIFPDKAMVAGQHWHYARNDGPLSHHAIHRMLAEMTKRVSYAKRMHPETPCTAIDPKDVVHIVQEGGGLDRNEYICYNEDLIQKEYLSGCKEDTKSTGGSEGSMSSGGSDGLSTGAIVGIVIGSVAVVGIIAAMIFMRVRGGGGGSGSGKEVTDGGPESFNDAQSAYQYTGDSVM